MGLRIRNKIITESLENILYAVRRELTNGLLKDIDVKGNDIIVTCPVHKDGHERNPSCRIYNVEGDENTEYGQVHCFSCGYTASFAQLIGYVFGEGEQWGEDWLIERYGNIYVQEEEYLPEIILDTKPNISKQTFLDENVLFDYDFYHPYMWQRKLSKEVVDTFRVGYDKERQAITFPVYDEKHRLVMVTARSVNSKRFWIPAGVDKPVYLLYYIIENRIDTAFVCESQINALTLWSYGFPAIALFGTGSYKQYEILRKCGVRNFYTCFDGDEPGQKGALRFRKNMPKDVFITELKMPVGKDVNDLTKDEFISILQSS